MHVSQLIDAVVDSKITTHAALTTGVHGVGSDYIAKALASDQAVSKIVWKDASEVALNDDDRTALLDWTDLDLTAYTSANAKFAILLLDIVVDSISAGGSAWLWVRKDGTEPTISPGIRTADTEGDEALAHRVGIAIVGMASGQVIEYKIAVFGTIQVDSTISVLGYIE